jgi:hypothetical protein
VEKNLNQSIKWIKEGVELGYLISINGKYKLTGKVNRENNLTPSVSTKAIATNPSQVVLTKQDKLGTAKELLTQFRKDAEIPFRINNDKGIPYTVSAISAEGTKAFLDIINSGIDYQTFVYSTKLYYKRNGFRKILTNYFVQGDWEVEYNEFKDKLKNGDIQSHISKELGNGTSNTEGI